ncbi:hypothetical protein [Streptomyces sp. MMG1121]|uniref:hypothetical protein n=1 Tax=Streptomyces sp. MMG1121 TaxID=1415544 RepID=UPI0006ADD19B|nr:hypothetical protein [Streptomyces sp. MMG1121]KOV65511.1 hypothetical protein ADK64_14680 [Streptomyces sp. MMG1121]
MRTHVAAAVGCSPTEVGLSRALVSHFAQGAATMATTPAAMSQWGVREGGSHRAAEREALLRGWVG